MAVASPVPSGGDAGRGRDKSARCGAPTVDDQSETRRGGEETNRAGKVGGCSGDWRGGRGRAGGENDSPRGEEWWVERVQRAAYREMRRQGLEKYKTAGIVYRTGLGLRKELTEAT